MSYKTECPKCQGHNFYVTEHNGIRYCFNCGYVEKEGYGEQVKVRSEHIPVFRDLYKELAFYYHSNLDTEHRNYLYERGLTDESINRLQIGYCPDSSHILYTHPLAIESGVAYKGKAFLANRIIFPYWVENEVTDLRGRIFQINDDRKYLSLFQSGYFRGADYAYLPSTNPSDTIVITEGEIKAILPEQYNIPTKGIPGMLSQRQISIYPYKKAILCFDNQRYGRRQLFAAIKKWVERIPHILIATLPLRGKDKQDIDSYILSYGVQAFQDVLKNAIPYNTWKGLVMA
jgi:DNA primase